jgi:ribosomal protein L11 methyltransferase
MWESLPPPLWKAFARVALDETDRTSALFELIPSPAPQAVIVLTHPHEDDAVVEAYYSEEPDADALRSVIGDHVKIEPLPDHDWVKLSQEGLPPVRAGRFFVYGAHDRGKVPPNVVGLKIDAAIAFGTGHHETTRGCLELLEGMKRLGHAPRNALDLGSGTGVLALAADRLWRIPVLATDIDPRAVEVCIENVRANGGQARVRSLVAEGFAHHAIAEAGPFDLIIANILAGPLTFLARDIRRMTAPKGRIILSGLLRVQEPMVIAFYVSQGFRLERRLRLGPWSALQLCLGPVALTTREA